VEKLFLVTVQQSLRPGGNNGFDLVPKHILLSKKRKLLPRRVCLAKLRQQCFYNKRTKKYDFCSLNILCINNFELNLICTYEK